MQVIKNSHFKYYLMLICSISIIFCFYGCSAKKQEGSLSFEWLETGLYAHNPYKIWDGDKYFFLKVAIRNSSNKEYHFNDSNADFRIEFKNEKGLDTLRFYLRNDVVLKSNTTDTLEFTNSKFHGILVDAFKEIENPGIKGRLIYKYSKLDSNFVKFFEIRKSVDYKMTVNVVDNVDLIGVIPVK